MTTQAQQLTFSPVSIAIMVSLAVHAAIVCSVNCDISIGSITNQVHSLQVSLMRTVESEQPKSEIKPKTNRIQQAVITPEPVVPQPESETTELTEKKDFVSESLANNESNPDLIQPPQFGAEYLNNPPPSYPLAARRRNIEGKVLLRAEIMPDGSCNQVVIMEPSPYDLLNKAAMDAVKKWRFIPATQNGKNVIAWVEIPIKFELENQRS